MKKFINIGILFILLLLILYPAGSIFAAQGKIKDTESATHGMGAADYTIVDTYTFPDFKVVQFNLPVLSIYSYLLISDGEALMIDPGRDVQAFVDFADKENIKIKGVYVSHSHADFVAGHLEMSAAKGCPVYQSKISGAAYKFIPLEDGSSLSVGKADVRFIETPGHTPDGMCAVVYSKIRPQQAELIFTGDVMFVGSVGRPDLMGGTVSAAWLASSMFDSWTKKLSRFDDAVKFFPAHGAGSLCGAHLSDDPFSTIGKERVSNPYFQYSARGAFVAALLDGLPEAPQYFKHNAQMNQLGPKLINWKAELPPEVKPIKDLMDNSKFYVVDLRDAADYLAGHIPNSVNIALRGRMETWTGIMVPWDSKLVLTGSREQMKEALLRLHRVGYQAQILSFDNWKTSGLPVNTTLPISPQELYAKMQDGSAPIIVDVRLPSEWMGLRIGMVLNMPLNKLDTMCLQLNPDEPVVAVCNSAYRSSLAVGIFERQGFKQPMSLEGGSEAWINASLPVIEAVKPGQASSSPKIFVKLPERISADQLKQMMMDLPGTFELIDIRPPEHFADFNLPGSKNVHIGEVISNAAFLIGPTPLILIDRDGSLAMAAGGILSQKANRPVKVLSGGLETYWKDASGAVRGSIPMPSSSSSPGITPVSPAPASPPLIQTPPPTAPKKKSAGC